MPPVTCYNFETHEMIMTIFDDLVFW